MSDVDDRLPRIDQIGHYKDADLVITHAIWRNGYGSYQPESGLRFPSNPDDFCLVEHGWDDWPRVTKILRHAVARRWPYWRICRLFEGRACVARLHAVADRLPDDLATYVTAKEDKP